ncbi:hypothetical protein E4T44_03984 [Aureobasidium sp. EXF-8845]|nr:hypothetical protein E4T44_03984 [Aureobasidium sp. EXF-8845]
MHRDATNSANTGSAIGTGRAALWPTTRVLLSPIQFRQRHQPIYPYISPCSTSSSDEEDEQDFYTPGSAVDPAMDLYASGNYSGDSNLSSEVDEDTDFYEVESSQPAAMADAPQTLAPAIMNNAMGTTQTANAPNPLPAKPPVAMLNTAKLHELRAKLLANRQATPVQNASTSVNNANAVPVKTELQSQSQSPAPTPNTALRKNNNLVQPPKSQNNRPTAASMLSQSNSIDALLAESHATATMLQLEPSIQQKTAPSKQLSTKESTIKPSAESKLVASKPAQSPTASHKHPNTAEQTVANSDKSSSTVRSPDTPNQQQNKTNTLTRQKPNVTSPVPEQKLLKDKTIDMPANQQIDTTKPVHALSITPLQNHETRQTPDVRTEAEDEYFKDVDLWLEITGFHDTSFREQKLKTFKMRAALEEKKRALEREFAELERQEAAAANDPSSKDYTRAVSTVYMPPPPLPAFASADEQSASLLPKASPALSQPTSAGAKRPRSPSVPMDNKREKLSRLNTSDRVMRRGDLFDKPLSASAFRRDSDQRPHFVNDRSDYRQRSPAQQSIPVRGQAFRPNDNVFNRRESWAPRSPEHWPARSHGWHSTPFSDVNEQPVGQGGHSSNKAAVQERFFIIKSWNMQNVIEAQRDGVWVTQEKNTRLFTDAFHSCHSVVLLFSVNKSMAFQGAAIMTTPPSASVPQPQFCKKLKWPCSPPFRIRWVCTTSVHFKFVGHLRNTMNLDEDGKPYAVLVGKYGQEVDRDAGEGVVEILREREEDEGEDDRP